ncbi:MAG: PilZ domain-containing protein [Planctomycetota bacterium]
MANFRPPATRADSFDSAASGDRTSAGIVSAPGAVVGERIFDERRHERKPWTTTLTVWVKDRSGAWNMPRKLTVATHDISPGGFSFFYQQFLHVNTLVSARFDGLPSKPVLLGVVANCTYLDGQYRVGVRFVDVMSCDPQLG